MPVSYPTKRIVSPKTERTVPNLLIDKLQQAHAPGYKRWASVFKLKEMAKTLNYLTEHGLLVYADLEAACEAAVQKYHEFSDCTKSNSARMQEISELQKHIGAYHKAREIYAQHCKLPPKKQGRKSKKDFTPNTPVLSFPARWRSGSLTAWV